MTEKITDVAVAVFIKADGSFLLSSRPDGKPYPGYWEFPGGKVEPFESLLKALKRELMEELNVAITRATPWFTFVMRYTHASVRLHCWRVHEWQGEMRGMEAQQFRWQRLGAITVAPILPGCVPIFNALALPPVYAITNASEIGIEPYLKRLEHALQHGLKMIQVREKNMPRDALTNFAIRVLSRAHPYGAKVLINSDIEMASEVGADGVHLTALQLSECSSRPAFALVAASAHCRAEIERAAQLKFDFVVLGAVKQTRTHPLQTPLGWVNFSTIVYAPPLPVYALGGMSIADMDEAMAHGAHGVAMQRGVPA